MKLLLSSVFKPFAVDDAYGRKENIMELMHNQVTREQGVFSIRYNHESAGLHLMADNVGVPTVVLDFPTQRRFIRELRKDYDYVGISFIVPNFIKAKRMAELVRQVAPRTKIILGGHGTSIDRIEELIDCDYVCRGEGIRFLRELFGSDVNSPIRHPILYSAVSKKVMGAPIGNNSALIMPGVGCVNGCRFCCTTHYFNKTYTPFLSTGQEIFDLCRRIEKKLGITEFFVMDENFLKQEQRTHDLVDLMEKHNKPYSFGIFSSAEAVLAAGIDFLERLGISFLWMGVESKREIYDKNKNVEFKTLVKSLRDRGIGVLASGILFLEHHTKETIHEDIDFLVGLNADFVQFMQLGPMPGTKLFRDYEKKGLLRTDLPYEEWHGQHQIWFNHEHFSGPETATYLKAAFQKDYEVNGPSILRLIDTAFRGVLNTKNSETPFMKARHQQRIHFAKEIFPLLSTLSSHAPTAAARTLARDVKAQYRRFFGAPSLADTARSLAVKVLYQMERVRASFVYNNRRKVKTRVSPYRMSLFKFHNLSFAGKLEENILNLKLAFNQTPAAFTLSGVLDTKNIKRFQSCFKKYMRTLQDDETSIELNLSNVSVFDQEALERLFKRIQTYQHRFKIVYSQNMESTVRAIEKLTDEFHRITLVLDTGV